jgi:hypothetical protein
MLTDTTIDAQIRRSIQKTIEGEMPLRLLKRIVYEVRRFIYTEIRKIHIQRGTW